MNTKEYYFVEKEYIPTARQIVLDVLAFAVRILFFVEGFGFILFHETHLTAEQMILCLAIELVYKFIKKEKIEISISSVLEIKESGIFLKRTAAGDVYKESVLSIPWNEVQKVIVLRNRFIKIYGMSRHELYINKYLVEDAKEDHIVLPLQKLKKEEIEEICNMFEKNSISGGTYEE